MLSPDRSNPWRVLLVEDDVGIGSSLQQALGAQGYDIVWAADGAAARHAMGQALPDLVLLDAGLPDVDGFSLCREFRAGHRDLPIVIVTARDADIDIVLGLDAGATDYVTKPFSLDVLLARMRAHLRAHTVPEVPIAIGHVRVDTASFTATLDGEPLDLRTREFELLAYLARRAGTVVRREQIMSDVWDVHWDTSSKTLEMHVAALRRKLGDAVTITAVRGIGYRLESV